MRWEAIYEPDVYDGAYGFWPGRSPPEALPELRQRCLTEGRGWSGEADVRGYFDSIESPRLREGRRQRVNEGRMRRLRGPGWRAGGMEHGARPHSEPGVVQGGVIAPVLANVFLHHGLEAWFARAGQPRMPGRGCLMRVADACVIGGAREEEARKSLAGLPSRLGRFGRTIAPTTTTLRAFRTPEAHAGADRGNGPCACRGWPHDGTKARQGVWVSKRRPARNRLRRPQKALGRWWRTQRHAPLPYPYQRRCSQRRGPCPYDGVRGTFRLLEEGRRGAETAWRYGRRRRRGKKAMGWAKCAKLLQAPILPIPRIVPPICLAMQGRTVRRQSGAEALVTEAP